MLYCKQVNLNNQNDSLTQIYNLIPAKAKILDVGCATGGLAYSLVKNKNCQAVGIEYNPQSVEICQSLNIFTQIIQYDMNNFELKDFNNYIGYFDYIICADILEHLLYPEKTLKELLSLLKNDGHMIISLPNVAHASIKANLLLNDFTYTQMGILDKTHLHFYTYKSIAEMLAACNLKIMQAGSVSLPVDGWQPHKIAELPENVANFITQDKHSHIMQYVMLCQKGKPNTADNISILNNLDMKPIKSDFISKIKRIIMLKAANFIKYIEAFRK